MTIIIALMLSIGGQGSTTGVKLLCDSSAHSRIQSIEFLPSTKMVQVKLSGQVCVHVRTTTFELDDL